MFFSKFFKKNDEKSQSDLIEEEFNKGNIVLPTNIKDYENYEEFKDKTSHLENIQNNLSTIEKNGE